jgi:hypothetical protein
MGARVVVFPTSKMPISATGKGMAALGATVAATLIVREGGDYLYRNRKRIKEGLDEALEGVEEFIDWAMFWNR